jgi:cell division protease FtsH
LSDCYDTATDLLKENLKELHSMAKALVDYETLDHYQIDDIMAGGQPRAPATYTDTKDVDKNDPKVGDAAEQS